jgi:membrane protein YqaA with SNARE-associated domain
LPPEPHRAGVFCFIHECVAMIWQYVLVFLGAMAVDIVPIPLPPAFTIMVLLQSIYDLEIWTTIVIGVVGSIVGRLVLTLYIPKISGKIFNREKNEDIQYLGNKMKQKTWKGQLFVLLYSLMPLPTTPLFLGAGIAKLKPFYIIPAFTLGKFISDTIAVFMGDYAIHSAQEMFKGMLSWKSIVGLTLGLLLIFALIFIDWHTLLRKKKLTFKFKVWGHDQSKK